MSTFRAVDDAALVELIRQATRRVVFIAPGLYLPVAEALCRRFGDVDRLEVTLILDADEDVCRIGFGELKALELVHEQAKAAGFYVRAQPGLRVGVLLVDEQTLVWSPTPRSVEATPDSRDAAPAPNGLLLGRDPGRQIASAVAAEGTETDPRRAEIGTRAVTPTQVRQVSEALAANPPIPVDLARVTRVFSTKLQFVEFKVSRARLSQQQISLSSDLLNADASEHLRHLLDSKLKAFSELKDTKIEVPLFVDGQQAFRGDGKPLMERVTETTLQRERTALEAEFLHELQGFGKVIELARKAEFEQSAAIFEKRLQAHSEGLRKVVAEQTSQIVGEALALIRGRAARAGGRPLSEADLSKISDRLHGSLARAEDESPKVSVVFKGLTWEQTQDPDFARKLDKALPVALKRRLGNWFEEFVAAKQAGPQGTLL